MKITFPHMGDAYIPVKILLDCAGIEYVMPPVSGKGLLEQGTLHSPEFACLPFKTIMGTLYTASNMVPIASSSGRLWTV